MKTLLAFLLGVLVAGLVKVSADEHRIDPVPLVHAAWCVPPMSHWQFQQRRIA